VPPHPVNPHTTRGSPITILGCCRTVVHHAVYTHSYTTDVITGSLPHTHTGFYTLYILPTAHTLILHTRIRGCVRSFTIATHFPVPTSSCVDDCSLHVRHGWWVDGDPQPLRVPPRWPWSRSARWFGRRARNRQAV